MLPVESALKAFTGLNGLPLNNGYIYFGVANQNPITSPITVYWDAAGTQPAVQPLRTINGYIVRHGTPANVFVGSSYSELVQDSAGRQVYFARTSDDFSIATVVLNFLASLIASGGSALISFLQAGVGAVVMTVEAKLRQTVNVNDFGAVGDGSVDDVAAITAAYAAANHVEISYGSYRINSNLTMSKPTLFRAGAAIIVSSGATLTIGADIIAGKYRLFNVEAGGNIVITNGAMSEIIPAWFGANVWYGSSNAVYGTRAGENLLKLTGPATANYMTIFGYRAAENMSVGLEGAFFGTFAGAALVDGTSNTGLGYAALRGAETAPGSGVFTAMNGAANTGVGTATLQNATQADNNVAVGFSACRTNLTPNGNVIVGSSANRLGTVGKENVMLGSGTGYSHGTTNTELFNYRNVFLGYNAASNATEGYLNVFVGALSGFYCTNPLSNTFCGYNTGPLSALYSTVTKSICIGAVARTQADNTITIGNSITETVAGRIRIGASADQTSTMLGPKTLTIGDSAGASIFVGTGTPEAVVTATVGSLFLRTDAATSLYVKQTGTGNTGWIAK
jgi:hypothetical protein